MFDLFFSSCKMLGRNNKSSKDCLHIQMKTKWTKLKHNVLGTYSRSNPQGLGMRVLLIRILGTAAEGITWSCWWVMWSSGVFSLQHWWGGLWVCVCVQTESRKLKRAAVEQNLLNEPVFTTNNNHFLFKILQNNNGIELTILLLKKI